MSETKNTEMIGQLEELIRHAWAHTAYPDCGHRQMTTGPKRLYDTTVGRRCTACGASEGISDIEDKAGEEVRHCKACGVAWPADGVAAWMLRQGVSVSPAPRAAEVAGEEYRVQLEAWQSEFGTTQLTHALARLERAERGASEV